MNKTITIKNDLGEQKTYDVLFTFESNDTGKRYL